MSHARFEEMQDEMAKIIAHMKDQRGVATRTGRQQVEDARRLESLKTRMQNTRAEIVAHEHAVKGHEVDKLEERTTHIASFRARRGSLTMDPDTSTAPERRLSASDTRRGVAPACPQFAGNQTHPR